MQAGPDSQAPAESPAELLAKAAQIEAERAADAEARQLQHEAEQEAAEAARRERETKRRARARARIERRQRAREAKAAEGRLDLKESLRQVGEAGRSTLDAAHEASKSFRTLLAADVSLARSAFGRTLAFTGVAIAFGASSWLLLMSAGIVFLNRQLGWSWALALLLAAGLSITVTVLGGWMAMRYFEHTRMQATRRQLARLGMGELADYTPPAGSSVSTKEATEQVATETPAGEPVKGDSGVEITPP